MKRAIIAAVILLAASSALAAFNIKLSTALRNAMIQAVQVEADADAGANSVAVLYICSDASAQVACSSYVAGAVCTGASVVLAELPMSSPSAPAASGGVLTFSAITTDSVANATGTASWFTILDQADDGSAECVFTGTVGTSGTDIVLSTTAITLGAAVSISSATLTAPGA